MLQLNLVEDGGPLSKSISSITSKLKKGGWRQRRLDAKRIVHKIRKANKPVTDTPVQELHQKKSEITANQQIFKRKIVSKKSEQRIGSEQKNFTSSLFTANPDIKIAPKPRAVIEPVVKSQIMPGTPESVVANPPDLKGFVALGLNPALAKHLQKLKITSPTEIQNESIPKLLNILNRDMIIQAQTGSGKTFSFLLPILNHLMAAGANREGDLFSRSSGCFALILVPTRELAQQISAVLESLLKYTSDSDHKHWIVSGLITGGESKKSEKSRLRKGINILVATPGRLLDHLKTTESFSVGNVRWLVLDEADNLLHLGFEETLKEILFLLNQTGLKAVQDNNRKQIAGWPFERQTILCSATIKGGVEKLAQESLRNPLFIKAQEHNENNCDSEEPKGVNDMISIPAQLKQHYVLAPAKLRLVCLIGLLRKIAECKKSKVIVFLATGDSVDWHFDAFCRVSEKDGERDDEQPELKLDPSIEAQPEVYNDLPKLRKGYETKLIEGCRLFKLHGSLQQSERHAIFTGFSPQLTDSSSILFCTDVAARGIDVPDVTHVIQYDPPADVRDYIHRIGRTARLGKDGLSYIFLLPSEVEYIDLLEDYQCKLVEQDSKELLETLEPLATTPLSKKLKHMKHEVAATDVHMMLERFVQGSQQNLIHAQKAFSSHIRAYTTHLASEKHIFHIKKLHFGHMAKSFCLREAPAVLQSKLGILAKNAKELKNANGGGVTASSMKRSAIHMAKNMMISEFSAGNPILPPIKKKKVVK